MDEVHPPKVIKKNNGSDEFGLKVELQAKPFNNLSVILLQVLNMKNVCSFLQPHFLFFFLFFKTDTQEMSVFKVLLK